MKKLKVFTRYQVHREIICSRVENTQYEIELSVAIRPTVHHTWFILRREFEQ